MSGNPALPTVLDRFFTVSAENDGYARHVRSSAGLEVIHSDRDDPAHWVQAGRACQRIALQAAALDIRHAHLSQPAEATGTYLPPPQAVLRTAPVPLADGVLIVGGGAAFFALIETDQQIQLGLTRNG